MSQMADILRRGVRASGRSLHDLSREAGFNVSILSRFMAGEGVTLSNAERLAEVLGYELRPKAGRARRKKGGE